MKNLEEQLAFYAAYHQDPRNKATHFVGVPLIMLAILVPLAWVVLGVLIGLGESIASLGAAQGWTWFAALFVGGWSLQLLGHFLEGRKPALVDNGFQIFVAPIFLCAEIFFALGYKRRLQSAAQERARRMRADA